MPQIVAPRITGRSKMPPSRREELIAGLMELFLEHGFATLSIEEMARALQCSKSTLYSVEGTKHEIIVTVVRAFFRRGTERVEARARTDELPARRIGSYLVAISEELAPASQAFFTDIDEYPPTREIYRNNTRIATERVQELAIEALPETSRIDAVFVGTVAGQIMEAIHRGEIKSATRLDDSAAYRALANLIVAGVSASTEVSTGREPA
ncbi:TetR/AcrR family transcriptional regulator [Pseudarthrobacter raffinosi]|uniref:TetR/AcrR family transcriptional regulator n=1 Tax=Pseudarthrobacter raffinosi TaxID=2953651 RepID=UPI00208F58C6|nr:TetR/AcrR family transcriptional regulator [Pseudarthrobacter sp. MDT3-9]MCO4253332.1 TetR/AcrR family transcriptional regulator [Pseudarthrobacter sp. MDT3-9]